MNDFAGLLRERTDFANGVIESFLPDDKLLPVGLTQAMNYSVLAGGKRLRPVFMDSFCRLYRGKSELVRPFMAAMEFLHTYSLVHDDMPAIDNDDLRRGMPTTHKKYGEACALLAGDGLLHYSQQICLEAFDSAKDYEDTARVVKALKVFADKSSIEGMLGGQAVDVLLEGDKNLEQIELIYRLKTCALLEASMMIGAILAGAGDEEVCLIENIGRNIGMAFQIKDDILDCTGDENVIGKPVGSDEKNNKATYATLVGIDKAQSEVRSLSDDAERMIGMLSGDNEEKEFLLWLTDSLVNRNY